ncbi:protein HEXIM1-like isoform X1 [Solea solea]|uniref:protein HEXIM1-like isoform X1 n=1 Tax=Solea solea TaxID=90069 RepID=UPI00272B2732|nr:protein HEXIM1-like isoform X1 [Solea solea]
MAGDSQENLKPLQSNTRSGHELQQPAENGREVLTVLAGSNNLPNLAQPHLSDNVQTEANANLIPQGENRADGPPDEGFPTDNDSNKSPINKRSCLKATTGRHKISEPLDKHSYEDFRVHNERQGDRDTWLREEMFTQRYPMAPHNTTRYLMDEHEEEELDFSIETREEFLQRNFCEELETFHVEKLLNMSKNKLVQEYLELERCKSHMEEENKLLRSTVVAGVGLWTASWSNSES